LFQAEAMTRPFGVKGKKRKHSQSKQNSEEEHPQPPPKKVVAAKESKEPSSPPQSESAPTEEDEVKVVAAEESKEPSPQPESVPTEEDELSGIPIAPSEKESTKPNVIFILERASLEVAKVGKVLLPTLLFLILLFFFTLNFHSILCLFFVFMALQTYQLLNSDDHANFLRKNNKNPGDYRPDITHQVKFSPNTSYSLLLSMNFAFEMT